MNPKDYLDKITEQSINCMITLIFHNVYAMIEAGYKTFQSIAQQNRFLSTIPPDTLARLIKRMVEEKQLINSDGVFFLSQTAKLNLALQKWPTSWRKN